MKPLKLMPKPNLNPKVLVDKLLSGDTKGDVKLECRTPIRLYRTRPVTLGRTHTHTMGHHLTHTMPSRDNTHTHSMLKWPQGHQYTHKLRILEAR